MPDPLPGTCQTLSLAHVRSRAREWSGARLGKQRHFSWFQTVKNGRGGNGRGDDAKTGWLLSLLL